MSDLPPPVENALRMSQVTLAALGETLKQYSEVTQSRTGAELLQTLDCAWMSTERLWLELAIAAGDIVIEDKTKDTHVEVSHE